MSGLCQSISNRRQEILFDSTMQSSPIKDKGLPRKRGVLGHKQAKGYPAIWSTAGEVGK